VGEGEWAQGEEVGGSLDKARLLEVVGTDAAEGS